MPAGRAARPRPPSLPAGQPRRAGRAGTGPAAPSRTLAGRNAWQPRPGAILSGRGAAQPPCFRLFPGPRPTSPGPRLPAEWEEGVTWRGEGRGGGGCRDRALAQAREAPGGGPDLRSRRPGGRVINSARRPAWTAAPPRRYLRAPPGSTGGPGTPSPVTDSGLTGQRRGAPAANHRPRFPYL